MDIWMTKNRMKELSYYLFFGLMVFAKGIGLDSGRKSYYILSAAACACIFCKLILTRYNIRQILAMGVLCLIAFVAYRNSGRMGILLTVLAIIGIKDMDVKKLFRLGLAVYGCSFAFTVIMAKFGLIYNPMAVHEKGGMELIRWGMGYSTGNVFHVSYFMLTVYLCYTWGAKYNIKKMLELMAGNLIVFLYSLSYTGIAVTAFYLLLNLYAAEKGKAFEKKSDLDKSGQEMCAKGETGQERCTKGEADKEKRFKGRLNVWERILCQLPLPLCLLFSLGGPFLLDYPFMQKLNVWLQARLSFSAYFLQNQPITLFGARMKNIPNFWIIMDNGYVYIMMTYGIVPLALFCAGYAILIARYSGIAVPVWGKQEEAGAVLGKEGFGQRSTSRVGLPRGKERLPELAIIFSFLLYGIMEQFISNAFMNLSLLFMGEILFGFRPETGGGEALSPAACEGAEACKGTEEGPMKKYLPKTGKGMDQKGWAKKALMKKGFPKGMDGQGSSGMKAACYRGTGFWPWLAGMAIGLGIAGFYLAFVPVKEYVAARLDTVMYVDAQSVQIWTENEGNTEEGLKDKMENFRELLADEELLERAIRDAGLEDRLSQKELAAALELSVPVAVQGSGQFDTFRVRILELYWDIADEEYGRLLEGILRNISMSGYGLVLRQIPLSLQTSVTLQAYALPQTAKGCSYMVKDNIYKERVGKSFGEDRIEHISGKEQYFIEKTGSIVELEHYRDGVFWGIVTAAAVWLSIWLRINYKPILYAVLSNRQL